MGLIGTDAAFKALSQVFSAEIAGRLDRSVMFGRAFASKPLTPEEQSEQDRRLEAFRRKEAEAKNQQASLRASLIGKRLIAIEGPFEADGDQQMTFSFEGGLSIEIRSGASGWEVESSDLDWEVVEG